MILHRLAWVLAPLAFTCSPRQAAAPAPDGGTCMSVCARYRELDCPAGRPTPAGVSCEVVCGNAGPGWNLGCRAAAASCEAADHCEAK